MGDAQWGSRRTTARDALEGARRDAVDRILVFWDGGFTTLPLPPRGRVLIGRGDECDVRVEHRSVSRKHATIMVDGSGVRIADMGSANGTHVGQVRIDPSEPIPLPLDTPVQLGSSILLIQRGFLESAPLGAPVTTARTALLNDIDESTSQDEAMHQVRRLVAMVAQGTINVLITGETGTGKEILARSLHRQSPRAASPFIGINCAALPDSLFESELFGYERGAFTGATQPKSGLLESAAGGTIFLDEIGELPLAGQAKLLRALEQREVTRVGGLQPRPIDVRFLAATNRRLEECVAAGEFREDLFYRLNAVTVAIPPLRERTGAILALARGFLSEARAALHRHDVEIESTAGASLLRHRWPGNVRQLRNVMERAALLCTGDVVTVEHLGWSQSATGPTVPPSAGPAPGVRDLGGEIETLERARIERALDEAGGNQTRAAELLGITRRILGRRLERYGIAPRRHRT
jgi:transcriptional regulator with PAS, ATPase and Fis domain